MKTATPNGALLTSLPFGKLAPRIVGDPTFCSYSRRKICFVFSN